MAQDTQAASSGAVDGSFPSPEIIGEAGSELAQKLGLSLEEALDKVVSTVLQQRGGGASSWRSSAAGAILTPCACSSLLYFQLEISRYCM